MRSCCPLFLKMDKIDYQSSDSQEEHKETPALAPEVDVTELVYAKQKHELQRFERETAIDRE